MKTISGFVFLMAASAFAVCTAQTPATSSAPVAAAAPVTEAVPPRTLPSHPDAQSAASEAVAPPKDHSGAYAGYRRIVSNGQERYCRNDVATGSHTERKAVCLTEAQVRMQELKTQQFMQEVERRAGSEQTLPYMYGGLSSMARR